MGSLSQTNRYKNKIKICFFYYHPECCFPAAFREVSQITRRIEDDEIAENGARIIDGNYVEIIIITSADNMSIQLILTRLIQVDSL